MSNSAIYQAPAEVGSHLAHLEAISKAKELLVGQCFGIPMDGMSRKLLADLVADLGVSEKKKFVLTDHDGVYAVSRLPDDYNLATWRKNRFGKNEKMNEQDEQVEAVRKAVAYYATNPWDRVATYCVGIPEAIKHANIVPYCYLQRKLACLAIFRKDGAGANASLKDAVKKLCELGIISEIPRTELMRQFKNGSWSCSINVGKIMGSDAE